jgi:hypothetical protein
MAQVQNRRFKRACGSSTARAAGEIAEKYQKYVDKSDV